MPHPCQEHMATYKYINAHTHTRTCTHTHVRRRTPASMHTAMYTCMCVHTHVHKHTCTRAHPHIHGTCDQLLPDKGPRRPGAPCPGPAPGLSFRETQRPAALFAGDVRGREGHCVPPTSHTPLPQPPRRSSPRAYSKSAPASRVCKALYAVSVCHGECACGVQGGACATGMCAPWGVPLGCISDGGHKPPVPGLALQPEHLHLLSSPHPLSLPGGWSRWDL